mmetsp:Transcript_24085/g.37519  ORF Transcript_24085/g.37519 Transcript_24085/m.37519 type:complete len:872 (-) Transcript_24085:76-2691(-)
MGDITTVDVVVVGGGFGGIHHVIHAVKSGFSVVGLERWETYGGTWHSPNYPGAYCDIECNFYSYYFDKDLQKEWKWPTKYASGETLSKYQHHVAKKYELEKYYQFGQNVVGASFDEETSRWTVKTEKGSVFNCQFLIFALGCLSTPFLPTFARKIAEEKPEGFPQVFHSSRFPKGLDLAGKNVVVIGTGSTSQQVCPEVAKVAKKLTVLQRTANYSIPNGFSSDYSPPEDWDKCFENSVKQAFGFDTEPVQKTFNEMTEEERQAELERRWEKGGFYFTGAMKDLFTNIDAARYVGDFVNNKTRALVKDPQTAENLCPTYIYGCKRPSMSMGLTWWETFNRENVELVPVKQNPIKEIVKGGVALDDGRIVEADVVVCCSGFDAMTGSFFKINPVGRKGVDLKSVWEAGSHSYLGMATAQFPNFFWIAGPQSPSVLSSMILMCEESSNFIIKALEHTKKEGKKFIEPKLSAQMRWTGLTGLAANAAVMGRSECGSWYRGQNVPGKPDTFNIFLGFDTWKAKSDEEVSNGFPSFYVSDSKDDVKAEADPLAFLHPSCSLWLQGLMEFGRGKPAPEMTPAGQRAMFQGMAGVFGQGADLKAPHKEYKVREDLPITVFTPPGEAKSRGCLFWCHGGGFVIGDHVSTHMTLCRDLAASANVVVVLPGYRLAPEHPYPAAPEDCTEGYEWVFNNSDKLGIDKNKIAIGGDSCGGNLTGQVILRVAKNNEGREQKVASPVCAGLFYPWMNLEMNYKSAETFKDGPLITMATLNWMKNYYFFGEFPADDEKTKQLEVSGSVGKGDDNLAAFPPTFIRVASADPLRDDGLEFAELLKKAGVTVDSGETMGVIHLFIQLHAQWEPAKQAFKDYAEFVKKYTQ